MESPNKIQLIIATMVLGIAFSLAAAFAINDFNVRSNDAHAQILRSCGIDPVTGGSLNAR